MKGLPRSLILFFAGVAAFWGLVIYQLSPQWMVYSGYHYGFGVPLLVIYLIRERWKDRPLPGGMDPGLAAWVLVGALAIYFPTRFIQEANPTWRLTTLLLGVEAVLVAFSLILVLGGRTWLKHFWFSTAFFLVSIPWPTAIESAVLQTFTRLNAGFVVEALTLLGIPALQQGNIIQLSTGPVGLEDACSGINSFQTTLMITLFLGELHRLKFPRRVLLTLAGVCIAFALNVARTFLLVAISAKAGGAVMEQWHDYAGYGILVLVFFSLLWLAKRLEPPAKSAAPVEEAPQTAPAWPVPSRGWAYGLIACLLLAELGTNGWYLAHEVAAEATDWTLELPDRLVTKDQAIMERAVREFRCDRGAGYEWREPNGARWQIFYFQWSPSQNLYNRTRVQLSKSHRPEICLPATGIQFRSKLPQREVSIGPVTLPVVPYVFEYAGVQIYVFFSVWEEGTRAGMAANMREDSRQRLRAALQGVRNKGQRLLEVIITGPRSEAEATKAYEAKLKEMIKA